MASAAQVPPQNIEIEESALGAMLVSEPAAESVLGELASEDFYLEKHAVIFRCIRDLRAASKPVDELTVANELQRREEVDAAGGKHYVSELAAKVPAAGNARHYAEIVRSHALDRRKHEIGHNLATNVLGAGEAIEELRILEHRAASSLQIRQADLSRVRPVRWLWDRRLLLGYLCLILGAEGVGKGTVAAWVIARATRGELPGDHYGTPTRVLVIADEDGFDSVWTPRLYAAGADIDLVDTLEDEGEPFDLRDGERLRAVLRKGSYSLLFIDALLDLLGADVDDWRSKDVRDRLRPLRRIARELEVCALGSLHPNKGQRGSFRDLVSGSHAFNASSRSSLLLAPHPEDEDRRVLVRGKGNLSAAPPSFEFAIEGRDLEINGHGFSLPVLADPQDGEIGIDDVIKPQREAPVRDSLTEKIDALKTGEVQTRADIARALGREPDDRSIGRALEQLESEERWEKVGRGKWRAVGIGTYRDVPMSKTPGETSRASGKAAA